MGYHALPINDNIKLWAKTDSSGELYQDGLLLDYVEQFPADIPACEREVSVTIDKELAQQLVNFLCKHHHIKPQ